MRSTTRRVVSAALAGVIGTGLALASTAATATASTSGRVVGEAANLLVSVGPTTLPVNDITLRSGGPGGLSSTLVGAPVNPYVAATGLSSSISTSGLFNVTSSASTAEATINVPGSPIVVRAVTAHATSDDSGIRGSATIAYLQIGKNTLVNQTPAPNTVISLGPLGKVVLNEQFAFSEVGITVNAIHVYLPSLGVDAIVAAASAGSPLDEPHPVLALPLPGRNT